MNYHQPSLNTILYLFYSQNHYIEILWSYLINSYGEIKAQNLFMLIIGQVLQQQNFRANIDERLIEQKSFGNLIYSILTKYSID